MDEFNDAFKGMQRLAVAWMVIVFILGLGALYILGKWLGVL